MGFKLGDQAEKSPVVHYANWKESIILQKQLNILNRTEKNVVHRIKIDQKVLFKRFQGKLQRSKITCARMWGDKDTERQLRSSNHRLNVDIVNTEKDYEFLDKLNISRNPKKPRLRYPNSSITGIDNAKTVTKLDSIIDDVFMDKQETENPRPRRRSFSEGVYLYREKEQLKNDSQKRNVRPSTTGGTRFDEIDVILPRSLLPNIDKRLPKKPGAKSVQFKGKTRSRSPAIVRSKTGSEEPQKTILKLPAGPKSQNGSGSSLPMAHASRHSSTSSQTPRSRRSSLFDSTEKPDIPGLMLEKLKRINFTEKVRDFCDFIEAKKEKDGRMVDYYSMRLTDTLNNRNKEFIQVPGTPEYENKRHIGNLNITSMTFKSLNFDFSRKEHINVEVLAPDITPVCYDDSDDDNDSDYSD